MTFYDILSPDGFSFFMDTEALPKSLKEAKKRIPELINTRYSKQGFYSSNSGRISLSQAIKQCTIKKLTL